MNRHTDVVLLGGGGAGLSLLLAIERAFAGTTPPGIVIVDPAEKQASDRTWCWWTHDLAGEPLGRLLHRSWSRMELFGPGGRRREPAMPGTHYVMLRSEDFYAEAARAADRLGAERITAPGRILDTDVDTDVDTKADRVVVEAGGERIAARWVFDSRPAPPARPARTRLLQHFRGWTVRLEQPLLDPGVVTLMDFRVGQPPGAVAFGYVLPLGVDRALVEYTEFGRHPLTADEYDEALRSYLALRWHVRPGEIEVEAVEDGVIPMTDAHHETRAGERVFRIGTAGGATRGSTGYTFAAMQRQAAAVAGRLRDAREPVPPPAYARRHRWMDAVLLRAIDQRHVVGADLFDRLFADVPARRLIRFLDGASHPLEELAVMRATPVLPMARAAAGDAVDRTSSLLRSVATRYTR